MLKFSILGALRMCTGEGEVEIPGDLQRVLVQTLLVSEGNTVSGGVLADEMWGECGPARQMNALQAHISRLRRRLQSLEPECPETRLVLSPSGYRLVVGPEELDATRFVRYVREAETLIWEDPMAAGHRLREGLLLWRGDALGNLTGGPICRTAAARYEEYRLRAMELLFDAQLSTDRHGSVLAELNEAHSSNPLRERFCQQLMVALYRSGRQAEALDTYRRMWHRLSEELGVQPSPALRRVERAILSHDTGLTAVDRTLSLLDSA